MFDRSKVAYVYIFQGCIQLQSSHGGILSRENNTLGTGEAGGGGVPENSKKKSKNKKSGAGKNMKFIQFNPDIL